MAILYLLAVQIGDSSCCSRLRRFLTTEVSARSSKMEPVGDFRAASMSRYSRIIAAWSTFIALPRRFVSFWICSIRVSIYLYIDLRSVSTGSLFSSRNVNSASGLSRISVTLDFASCPNSPAVGFRSFNSLERRRHI